MSEMRDVSTIPLEWDVADRMRKSLRVSGVGVQDMADYLGMSRNSISNWINGRAVPDHRGHLCDSAFARSRVAGDDSRLCDGIPDKTETSSGHRMGGVR